MSTLPCIYRCLQGQEQALVASTMDLCLGHADDLRSITISIALLEEQAAVYPGKWPSSKLI